MAATFEMVKYHSQSYPDNIPLRIEECAAHFDVKSVQPSLECSLHTEYCYTQRRFDSDLVRQFPAIISAQKNGVPQLWKDENWAVEFAQFLFSLAKDIIPTVIEVHPPFKDYTDWPGFIRNYSAFESLVLDRYPDVCILIENRCGSRYKGGRFLISKESEVEMLCCLISERDLRLRVAYDVPQIYTAHNVSSQEQYIDLLQQAIKIREYIGGVHLWGKRLVTRAAHYGDLTSYFENDLETKEKFLQQFEKTFNDGITRKMVLEVNSGNEDLLSIVFDLQRNGVVFL